MLGSNLKEDNRELLEGRRREENEAHCNHGEKGHRVKAELQEQNEQRQEVREHSREAQPRANDGKLLKGYVKEKDNAPPRSPAATTITTLEPCHNYVKQGHGLEAEALGTE